MGALVQRPLAAVIARPGVARPRELEGKRVGVTGLPSDEAVLRAVVEDDGGDYTRVRAHDDRLLAVPSLIAGKVDAVVAFWNAEGVALRRRGVRDARVPRRRLRRARATRSSCSRPSARRCEAARTLVARARARCGTARDAALADRRAAIDRDRRGLRARTSRSYAPSSKRSPRRCGRRCGCDGRALEAGRASTRVRDPRGAARRRRARSRASAPAAERPPGSAAATRWRSFGTSSVEARHVALALAARPGGEDRLGHLLGRRDEPARARAVDAARCGKPSVATNPGSTSPTCTPCGLLLDASESVQPASANLLAAYAPHRAARRGPRPS